MGLARAALDHGDAAGARLPLIESWRHSRPLEIARQTDGALIILAGIAIAEGQLEQGARLLGAAIASSTQTGGICEPSTNSTTSAT